MRKSSMLINVAVGVLCLAVPVMAYADDTMVISAADDSKIAIADISQITFADGIMVVATADGEKKFTISDVEEITFDLVINGIDNVSSDLGDDVAVSVADGVLTVTAPDATVVVIEVYDMGGARVASSSSHGMASIDMNQLAAGAYIVRANNKIIKFIR